MIKHDGIVIAVNANGTVRVKIVQTSACAACKAKAMCASTESKEKEIEAIGDGLLAVGDTAEVLVQQKLGWKAVLLAYILPFVVMLGVVVIGNGLQVRGEEIVGTIALCAMGVYYIVLGFFKDKIQKEFSFTAVKKQ
jgi:sigma-E factor negative regulatory protein RseC